MNSIGKRRRGFKTVWVSATTATGANNASVRDAGLRNNKIPAHAEDDLRRHRLGQARAEQLKNARQE